MHVREQGGQVRAGAGERGQQQVVLLGHVPGEQRRDPFRDGGGLGAVRAGLEPPGEICQRVVLGSQGADQLAAAGVGSRRRVEGAFLRLGMGQDLAGQVLPERPHLPLERDTSANPEARSRLTAMEDR